MMYVEFMKNFLLADSTELWAIRLILSSWAQTFHSYFLDMMYVQFRKIFFLGRRFEELMAIGVISASWAQKRLIPTFYT